MGVICDASKGPEHGDHYLAHNEVVPTVVEHVVYDHPSLHHSRELQESFARRSLTHHVEPLPVHVPAPVPPVHHVEPVRYVERHVEPVHVPVVKNQSPVHVPVVSHHSQFVPLHTSQLVHDPLRFSRSVHQVNPHLLGSRFGPPLVHSNVGLHSSFRPISYNKR